MDISSSTDEDAYESRVQYKSNSRSARKKSMARKRALKNIHDVGKSAQSEAQHVKVTPPVMVTPRRSQSDGDVSGKSCQPPRGTKSDGDISSSEENKGKSVWQYGFFGTFVRDISS